MNRPDRHFFVYILRCSDGSYYVGQTEDVQQRVHDHNEGRGATWTATRRPVELVYQESFDELDSVVRREAQLKRWSRAKKEALISGDRKQLKALSRRQST